MIENMEKENQQLDLHNKRIKSINNEQYRQNLKALLKICQHCKRSYLTMTLEKIMGETPVCNHCSHEVISLEPIFKSFWKLIGGSQDEIINLNKNRELLVGFRKILKIIINWGLNYPLIIPYTVKLEITNLCNLKCIHCIANSGKMLQNELSKKEIFTLINRCVQIGVINFGIVGGEPLLRKDIFEIIDYAVEKGLRVTLSTNAILVDEAIAERIAKSKIIGVAVSVDGLGKVHDQFRGVPGAFEKTITGIKNLQKKGVKVNITTVVSKHNLHQLGKIVDFIAEMCVNSYMVNEFLSAGRGKQSDWLSLSEDDFKQMTQILHKKRKQYHNQLLIRWVGVGNQPGIPDTERGIIVVSKCGAGLTELTVEADGGIRPCPFLAPINENIRTTDIERIWFESEHLKRFRDKSKLKGKCNKCKYQFSCGGGCRARAEELLKHQNAPDLRCVV